MSDSLPSVEDTGALAPAGFSAQELQHLLSSGTNKSTERSAELLGLLPLLPLETTVLVGGAALLVRGQLAVVDGTGLVPKDVAAHVGYALTNAVRWTILKGASAGASELSLYIESDRATVYAQPGDLGTWWFTILDQSVIREEVIVASVMSMALAAEDSAVIVRTTSANHNHSFSIQRRGEDWGYAYGQSDAAAPETLVEDAEPEAMLADLLSFITRFSRAD